MSVDIEFTPISEDDSVEKLVDKFCDQNGGEEHGIIPDSEYDRLYDHLGAIISKYASYSDDNGDADFMGSRYVDQVSWIQLVASDDSDPSVALKAALETIQSAHRPLAVSFDYYPEMLLVMPPNKVFSTFERERLIKTG